MIVWGSSYMNQAPSSVTDVGSNVVYMSCGNSTFIALKADGTVVIWGQFPNGPSSLSTYNSSGSFVTVSASGNSLIALTDSGNLLGFGSWITREIPLLNVVKAFPFGYLGNSTDSINQFPSTTPIGNAVLYGGLSES